MIRTALYVRFSDPAHNVEDTFGRDVQEALARAYAPSADLEIVAVYQDRFTGTKASREQLDRLKSEARSLGIQAVLFPNVGRLGRRVGVNYSLLEELLELGLEVHSADMGRIDPDDEMSAFNFGARSLMEEMDARRIVKRLRMGQLAKVRRGQPVVALYGYGYENGEVKEDEARWVRWMYEHALTHSTYATMQALNRMGVPTPNGGRNWGRNTVRNILTNTVYRGEYTFGKPRTGRKARPGDVVACSVPRIVEDELWYAVQRAVKSRYRNAQRPGSRLDVFPLQGRVRCAVCGSIMSGNKKEFKRRDGTTSLHAFYFCRNTRAYWKAEPTCDHTRYHHADRLHVAVRAGLAKLVDDHAALELALVLPDPAPPPDTSTERARLLARLERARNLALDGAISSAELKAERERIEAAIAELERLTVPAPVRPDLRRARARLRQALKGADLATVVREAGITVLVAPNDEFRLRMEP